ncbi:MAG: hypothetical protein ACP5VE_04910 [Chthonomonadales bacterium]
MAPWNASASPSGRIPWNPLAYDAVGQFYPWRAFAAAALRNGTIPLWNPYSFCGAPFVANSQSAVFYPPNLLFVLMPADRAFAVAALLHLVTAGIGMWLLLRSLGAAPLAGVAAGAAYAFCTWQVSWLQLPTFLDTSCWLPFALLGTLRLVQAPSPARMLRLAGVFALVLLAGHLQIALYVLGAAVLAAVYLLLLRVATTKLVLGGRWREVAAPAALWLAALVLGSLAAAPQLLPAVELSNRSHRAAPPSPAGYAAYTAYAVPPQSLATLFLPDLFGNPSQADLPYRGVSQGGLPFNYAEGALYGSMAGLLLAAGGVASRRHRRAAAFFGFLAALALLMAFGTPVDALLYFYLPGFGRSGAPGRALVVWAFSFAALAGLGMDELARGAIGVRRALGLIGITTICWAAVLAFSLGLPGAYAPSDAHLWRQVTFFGLSAAAVVSAASSGGTRADWRRRWAPWALIGVLVLDLLWEGSGYNSTARPRDVYPTTPAIQMAAKLAGHDRIAPINSDWSFSGPRAVLPPNAAMIYRVHDVQGYDSLFPGRYKSFMNRAAGPARDASPMQVGNMVFAKDPYSPLLASAGVRVLLSLEPLELRGAREEYADGVYLYTLPDAPGRAWLQATTPGAAPVQWLADGINRIRLQVHASGPSTLHVADELYPGWHVRVNARPERIGLDHGVFRRVELPAGTSIVEFSYEPESFKVGLYLMMFAVFCAGALAASRRCRTHRQERTMHHAVPDV